MAVVATALLLAGCGLKEGSEPSAPEICSMSSLLEPGQLAGASPADAFAAYRANQSVIPDEVLDTMLTQITDASGDGPLTTEASGASLAITSDPNAPPESRWSITGRTIPVNCTTQDPTFP